MGRWLQGVLFVIIARLVIGVLCLGLSEISESRPSNRNYTTSNRTATAVPVYFQNSQYSRTATAIALLTREPAAATARYATATARSSYVQATSTPLPRKIDFLGSVCTFWRQFYTSPKCIYGQIAAYGPDSNRWDTIHFLGADVSSLKIYDPYFYYSEPLTIGDCVVVYGSVQLRDTQWIFVPDYDTPSPIAIWGNSSECER